MALKEISNQSSSTKRKDLQNDTSRTRLEQAALDLLEEGGVLAGLNLREVADRANVNRGLVYHHFGSKEELLKSALRKDVKKRIGAISDGLSLPFNARIRQLVRTMVHQQPALKLMLLLLIDGDESVRTVSLRDEWRTALEKDIDEGKINDGLDISAFIALFSAMSYGYSILRNELANELELEVVELDWRVDELLKLLLGKGFETNTDLE